MGVSGMTVLDKGYFTGGATSYDPAATYYQFNDEYNSTSNSWSSKTAIPTPARQSHVSTTFQNKGYIIGGAGPSIVYSDNDEYNPSTDSWASKTDLIAPARSAAACFNL